MAVYIVTTESFPNGMAATARIRCYAKSISALEKCMVLIPNRLENPKKPLGNLYTKGSIDGYTYKYFGQSTERSNNSIIRKLNQLHDVLYLLVFLLFNLHEGDGVVFYSYDLFLGNLVSIVSHLKKANVFFELCEHPQYQCKGYPHIKNEDVKMGWVRRHLNCFDAFFVISHALQDYVVQCFGTKKTCLLPVLFETPYDSNKALVNDGIPYIIHTGALSQRKDGIIFSLKAFGEFSKKDKLGVNYLLTGDLNSSPDRCEIMNVIEYYGIAGRVRFLGFLSPDDIKLYQNNAYLTIVSKADNLQNNYCFATKIAEYLNAGCLLITTAVGEVKYYLQDGINCLFFNYDDVHGLAELIDFAFKNRIIRDEIAQKGKEIAMESFYCMNYSEEIVNFIKFK